MRIAIASDHAALDMKAALVDWLKEAGHEVADLGPTNNESVDYPDYGYKLAAEVASGRAERGVALCGSGLGISMVSEGLSAKLSREHNDANVIAMGARLVGIEIAKDCLDIFLKTPFGGDRHQRRVDKLTAPKFEGVEA